VPRSPDCDDVNANSGSARGSGSRIGKRVRELGILLRPDLPVELGLTSAPLPVQPSRGCCWLELRDKPSHLGSSLAYLPFAQRATISFVNL